jgi:hypothetical protein
MDPFLLAFLLLPFRHGLSFGSRPFGLQDVMEFGYNVNCLDALIF